MTGLRKVRAEDIPANRRRGGDIRVLLSPRTVGASAGFLGVLTLRPGEFVAEHYHPYSEEFLYLVRGQVDAWIDGQLLSLAAGEGVLVPIGSRHRIENNAEQEAFAVFQLGPLAPEPSLGHVDTEELPNPDAPHPEIASR
ncbi:cupin domain-containing protein [Crossiella sp. SN42]|uniref:cupin domain-containing protein n=1 Tax=Crossiella sp. SN42 TaxID=2944808 RepID=UPI00207D507C|nr:cupin domain-containing protein [Crossiella sp. SN42]MCO1580347.1 cupin domain-containing protein [Crossiella sp. SN42]